ncbi:MAG: molecular chaperone DnaJ [Chloroflexales bacterium]|nr:molecular chaperone DnaJ [Chloroflexales bacterium]
MVDFYAVLQVPRDADQATIEAVYQRLRVAYDPSRLHGVSDELRDLAAERAAALDQAFAIVGDVMMRAAYDAGITGVVERALPVAVEPSYDYRPLPAAGRNERTQEFDPTPVRKVRITVGERQFSLVLAIALPLAIVLATFIITDGGKRVAEGNDVQPVARAAAVADQFEQAIIDARAATVAYPTSIQAWVEYGNQLYNSVQFVREQQPDSPLYQNRIVRWQMAADAYAKALSFDPSSVVVAADLGASRCFYGNGTNNQGEATAGLQQIRNALAQIPDREQPRVLLNLGFCLAESTPRQSEEAIATWQKITTLVASDSPFAIQATKLIGQIKK